LDCGGRAKRRPPLFESGVALRFTPQSKKQKGRHPPAFLPV
jgi:hypothetical protein